MPTLHTPLDLCYKARRFPDDFQTPIDFQTVSGDINAIREDLISQFGDDDELEPFNRFEPDSSPRSRRSIRKPDWTRDYHMG